MKCLGVTELKGKAQIMEYQAQDNVYLRIWGERLWCMRHQGPICSCLLFREHCRGVDTAPNPCVPNPVCS